MTSPAHETHIAYLFHQGAPGNDHYSLHVRQPHVVSRSVPDGTGMTTVTLYETPDPFIFLFCLYGTERRMKVRIPLGEVRKMTFTLEPV